MVATPLTTKPNTLRFKLGYHDKLTPTELQLELVGHLQTWITYPAVACAEFLVPVAGTPEERKQQQDTPRQVGLSTGLMLLATLTLHEGLPGAQRGANDTQARPLVIVCTTTADAVRMLQHLHTTATSPELIQQPEQCRLCTKTNPHGVIVLSLSQLTTQRKEALDKTSVVLVDVQPASLAQELRKLPVSLILFLEPCWKEASADMPA